MATAIDAAVEKFRRGDEKTAFFDLIEIPRWRNLRHHRRVPCRASIRHPRVPGQSRMGTTWGGPPAVFSL